LPLERVPLARAFATSSREVAMEEPPEWGLGEEEENIFLAYVVLLSLWYRVLLLALASKMQPVKLSLETNVAQLPRT
jgi:hypothetical protein